MTNAALFSLLAHGCRASRAARFRRILNSGKSGADRRPPRLRLRAARPPDTMLVPLFIAYDVALYFCMRRSCCGWWTPSEALFNPDVLASYAPWCSGGCQIVPGGILGGIAVSRGADCRSGAHRRSTRESPPVDHLRLRRPGRHLSALDMLPYPTQPAYARPVELVIPSIQVRTSVSRVRSSARHHPSLRVRCLLVRHADFCVECGRLTHSASDARPRCARSRLDRARSSPHYASRRCGARIGCGSRRRQRAGREDGSACSKSPQACARQLCALDADGRRSCRRDLDRARSWSARFDIIQSRAQTRRRAGGAHSARVVITTGTHLALSANGARWRRRAPPVRARNGRTIRSRCAARHLPGCSRLGGFGSHVRGRRRRSRGIVGRIWILRHASSASRTPCLNRGRAHRSTNPPHGSWPLSSLPRSVSPRRGIARSGVGITGKASPRERTGRSPSEMRHRSASSRRGRGCRPKSTATRSRRTPTLCVRARGMGANRSVIVRPVRTSSRAQASMLPLLAMIGGVVGAMISWSRRQFAVRFSWPPGVVSSRRVAAVHQRLPVVDGRAVDVAAAPAAAGHPHRNRNRRHHHSVRSHGPRLGCGPGLVSQSSRRQAFRAAASGMALGVAAAAARILSTLPGGDRAWPSHDG